MNTWNPPPKFAEQHQIVDYYEGLARKALRKIVWQRRVKAFCIAIAVFCIVYFGGRELIGLVS